MEMVGDLGRSFAGMDTLYSIWDRRTWATLMVSSVAGGDENDVALPPFFCDSAVICGKLKVTQYLVASIIPIWIGRSNALSSSVYFQLIMQS
jgi:hypothetical protein